MKLAVLSALPLLVSATLPLAGCQKGGEGAGSASGSGATAAAPAIPPAPPVPAVASSVGVDGGAAQGFADPGRTADWVARTVTPLLEKEGKARPAGTPKAEEVLGAVEKAGVKLLGRNQALGAIVGAAYCLGADTESMVGVMVCEYLDEAAAQKGAGLAKQLFGLAMPAMSVAVKKKTTLSIHLVSASPATSAEVRKISDAFGKL